MRSPFVHLRHTAIILTAIVAATVLLAAPVPAVTFSVSTTADAVDANPGDGACATASATCSLRAAVQEANALAGPDVIELPAGTYDLAVGPREDASAAGDLDVAGDLTINGAGALTTHITSGLAGGTTAERALQVLSGIVQISGVDIHSRHFHETAWGGAIDNLGDLTVADCMIDGSVFGGALAGAIYNRGTLHIATTFVRGQAQDPDGPEAGTVIFNEGTVVVEDGSLTGAGFGCNVYNAGSATFRRSLLIPFGIGRVITNNDGASLTVEDSVLSGTNQLTGVALGGVVFNRGTAVLTRTTVTKGNVSGGSSGGGIYTGVGPMELHDCSVTQNGEFDRSGGIASDGPLAIVNSTISGNGGVGIATTEPVILRSSTVTDNHVVSVGTFLYVMPAGISGPAILSNTILAGNTFATSYAPDAPQYAADCALGLRIEDAAPITSEGYNLIQDTQCNLQGDQTGNIIGVDPKLAPLGDNGGPTETHLLLDDSPAIDAGNPDTPGSDERACPAADQRGVARPLGGRCDIGAVEVSRCGDGIVSGGETCDDGNTQDGDCCSADCRTEAVCPSCERCDVAFGGCVADVLPDCRASTREVSGQLRILPRRPGIRQRLEWNWNHGEATSLEDFGDPPTDGPFTFCVFDESGSRPTVAFRASTSSGPCGNVPCWSATAKGLRYHSTEGAPEGIRQLSLKPGADGKARIILKGRGVDLTLPTLPLGLPVRAQLHGTGAACWESTYTEDTVVRNTPVEFRGKARIPPAP
jgi:CSLREA domain-containing protein